MHLKRKLFCSVMVLPSSNERIFRSLLEIDLFTTLRIEPCNSIGIYHLAFFWLVQFHSHVGQAFICNKKAKESVSAGSFIFLRKLGDEISKLYYYARTWDNETPTLHSFKLQSPTQTHEISQTVFKEHCPEFIHLVVQDQSPVASPPDHPNI